MPFVATTPPLVRFWSKVDQSGGPEACWPYLGGRDKDGYGRFAIGSRSDGSRRTVRAHRFAFEAAKSESVPGDKLLCHTCDNPACCNPRHLFVGDALANNRDRTRKGRTAQGDAHFSR